MNLKRCDNNCTFFDKTTKRYCTCHKIERQIEGEDISLIGKLGCASHSDAGKEREGVLVDFIDWCSCFDDYTCGSLFTPSFVLKKLQELRQGGE